jgi:heterodisulfide reductase subunit B
MTRPKRYTFYPGCSLHSTAKDYLESLQAVCSALGLELVELSDWVCCGSTPAHATNEKLALALPLENLSRAVELGHDVVVACAACYNRLQVANLAVRNDPAVREEMAEIVGRPYDGSINVRHILDVLVRDVGLETIRELVRNSLENVKVASYYGCLLARPREVSFFDDPEDPRLMDDCMEAIGGEVVQWPYKTDCCGAAYSLTNPDMALRLTGEILSMAKECGADCVAVGCPLCQSNLDLRQKDIERQRGEVLELPVFYFTQLVGMALGLPEHSLGVQRLVVNPRRILRRLANQKDESHPAIAQTENEE